MPKGNVLQFDCYDVHSVVIYIQSNEGQDEAQEALSIVVHQVAVTVFHWGTHETLSL